MVAFSGASRCFIAAALSCSALGNIDIPVAGGKYLLREVEVIEVPVKPGFTALPSEVPGALLITSFDPLPFEGGNGVFIKKVGNKLQELPGSARIDWPNSITPVKNSTFGFPAVAIGSGFLVPGNTVGAVYLLEASATPMQLEAPLKLTKDKSGLLLNTGWFYHQAVPIDVDGDGLDDFVTARCQYGILPGTKKQGELIWLKQPATKVEALSGNPWEEHHLADGPDFLFCVHPNSARLALVAAEFISGRMVYWYMMPDGSMASRVLDDNSGPGFSCSWQDINGDGDLDLLATNHMAQNGSVFAYSFKGEDIATAEVTRHQLATGFTPEKVSAGNASPGDAIAFQPYLSSTGKPFLFLSGDNSNSIFLLVPHSESPDDWSYSMQELAKLGADVGRPSIGDTDGDGYADIYVPAYDKKQVLHYKVVEGPRLAEVLV